MADIRHLIGDRIRDLRKKKGLSQMELGWKAKLHHTYVGAVERGEKNVSVMTIDKISKALGVSLSDIFNLPPKEIKDSNKLKSLLVGEINKSDPEILRIALGLIRELNMLSRIPGSRKGTKATA